VLASHSAIAPSQRVVIPRRVLRRELPPDTPQTTELRLELARELVECRLPAADERELAFDERNRLLDDPEPLLVARVFLPAASQRGARLLRLGELDELLEGEAEQFAQPDQLRVVRDDRLRVRPVRAPLA